MSKVVIFWPYAPKFFRYPKIFLGTPKLFSRTFFLDTPKNFSASPNFLTFCLKSHFSDFIDLKTVFLALKNLFFRPKKFFSRPKDFNKSTQNLEETPF